MPDRATSARPSQARGAPGRALAIGALLAAATAASPALAAPPLHVEGSRFVDPLGRTVILRGVNVAGDSKVPPFTPASDPAIFEPLQAWGMNVVRLIFTWEAYEPSPGVYDQAYLDYYAAAARAAREHGLYVIVDFHQDAFSRFSIGGCGDGFPAWALPPDIPPATPDNGPACSSWGIKMQSDVDMKAAWQAFHSDAHGAKTRYLAMVESVSAHLAGEPGVIGYDLLNEPWGDEVTEIGPLYEEAATAVRKASPDAIVFVSPQALTSAGTQTKLLRPSFDNLAYAPHFYDATVVLFDSWSGVEPDAPFETMGSIAEAWNVPLFLGELGAPAPTEDGALYLDSMYAHLDARLASGAQWVYTPGWTEERKDGWNDEDFSIVDSSGAPRENFHPRPYPAKVSGVPTHFRAPETAPDGPSIELTWEHDPTRGITELFVPRQAFFATDQVTVETTGEDVECAWSGSWLLCTSPDAGTRTVRITPGAPAEPPACGLTGIELLPLALFATLRNRRKKRVGT